MSALTSRATRLVFLKSGSSAKGIAQCVLRQNGGISGGPEHRIIFQPKRQRGKEIPLYGHGHFAILVEKIN